MTPDHHGAMNPDGFTAPPALIPPSIRKSVAGSGERVSFGLVGVGGRSRVFLRLAYLLPDRFRIVGVVARRAEEGARVEREWGVTSYRTVGDLLQAERPDFVVASVPHAATPVVVRDLAARGVPVVAETPPAPDVGSLRSLWADVGSADLVQVAEQYALMPLHAARIELVRQGVVGRPTSVQISSTHLYHVVSLARALLGVGATPARVLSQTFRAPLVHPGDVRDRLSDLPVRDLPTTLATIDFGDGRMALYDFTENQWTNSLRPDHLMVRGSTGEIADESVVRLVGEGTPVTSRIERAVTGQGMNYEGTETVHLSFDGRVIFRNRFLGANLMDDDIAVAELLDRAGAWVRGAGPGPYPLAQAMQDQLIGLAITESQSTGTAVVTTEEPWSAAVGDRGSQRHERAP